MVANITSGSNVTGALLYNFEKVGKDQAHIVYGNRIFDNPVTGQPDLHSCLKSYKLYLDANKNTTDTVFHVSLNPDPKDKLTDETFAEIAQAYMKRMGYGDQPYIVFSHDDIDRKHYHIVSVRIDETGNKINDSNERLRSMEILRKLEHKYKLIPSVKGQTTNVSDIKKVEYGKENLKGQIASVVRYFTKEYRYGSLTELNALLNLYNVSVYELKGEVNGKPYHGIMYSAINETGELVGVPIKSSRIGKNTGFAALDKLREKNLSEYITSQEHKAKTRDQVIRAMHAAYTKPEFALNLKSRGIDVVFRANKAGRIYGVTFIDHNTKTVLNGSRLGKPFSANVFQELFNNPKADRAALLPKLPKEQNTGIANSQRDPLRHEHHTANDTVSSVIGAFDLLSVGLKNEPVPIEELEEIQNRILNKRPKKKKKKQTLHL